MCVSANAPFFEEPRWATHPPPFCLFTHARTCTRTHIRTRAGLFILLVISSTLVGLLTGLSCAFALKHGLLRGHNPSSEVIVFIVWSYASFLIAEAIGQSGIVASLVCGFTMNEFASPNLSSKAKTLVVDALKVLALASEGFIFVQVGINMSLEVTTINMGFICLTLFLCISTRGLLTASISAFHNWFRTPASATYIPWRFQAIIWHAGLRGAIAFAVAFEWDSDSDDRGLVISTTCAVILFTVIFQGGSSHRMLRLVNIPVGVEVDAAEVQKHAAEVKHSKLRKRLTAFAEWVNPYVVRQEGDEDGEEKGMDEDAGAPGGAHSDEEAKVPPFETVPVGAIIGSSDLDMEKTRSATRVSRAEAEQVRTPLTEQDYC